MRNAECGEAQETPKDTIEKSGKVQDKVSAILGTGGRDISTLAAI